MIQRGNNKHEEDQRSHIEEHIVDQISPEHGALQEGSIEQILRD